MTEATPYTRRLRQSIYLWWTMIVATGCVHVYIERGAEMAAFFAVISVPLFTTGYLLMDRIDSEAAP